MDASEDLLFVLRGWREGNTWRWSLVRSTDQQRLGFADLDSLYLFLAAQTAGTGEAPAKNGDQADD